MNWRTDPPNFWTGAYRIVMMLLMMGLYLVVAHYNGQATLVGNLLEWLIGATVG